MENSVSEFELVVRFLDHILLEVFSSFVNHLLTTRFSVLFSNRIVMSKTISSSCLIESFIEEEQ